MLETEPRDLLLDRDNDLVISNGDLVFSRGMDGVVQDCRIAMQMFLGEWFLDLDVGIPYWQSILGHKLDVAATAARLSMTSALRKIEDVIDVVQFDIDFQPSTRDMRIKWRVRCTFGDTPVDTLILSTGGANA